MLSVILPSMLMILLCILNLIRHLVCGNNLNWLLDLNLIYKTLWAGVSGLLSSLLGKLSWFLSTGLIAMVLLMWKWMHLSLWKSWFKMLGLTFSSKLDWGSYITSIAKTTSKKIEALSPEVALYLYKSTIQSCMEYCCHFRAGAPTCYLEILDKLQKQICRIVGPSLAATLEPLAHHWNVASLSLFYRYYFGRCSSELSQLVTVPFSWGRSACYSYRLHDFSVVIDVTLMSMSTVFFVAQLDWNSLPIEYFPLTYDLSCVKSRIIRHLFFFFS